MEWLKTDQIVCTCCWESFMMDVNLVYLLVSQLINHCGLLNIRDIERKKVTMRYSGSLTGVQRMGC